MNAIKKHESNFDIIHVDARVAQEYGLFENEKVKEMARLYEPSAIVRILMVLDQQDLTTLKVLQTYIELRMNDKAKSSLDNNIEIADDEV